MSYEDIIRDGERIVCRFIIAAFAVALVVYLLLTAGQHTTQYKKPCVPEQTCVQR